MILEIKVVPSAGRSAWALDKNGQIKCYIKSPPERGLANQEVVKTIAKALGIPQNSVQIVSGLTSPKKRLKIDAPLLYEDIMRLLGLDEQKSFIK